MKRGFSLVEAAILLGVTGLIIGGIWLASAAMTNQFKITEISKGILTTADNVRKNIPLSNYPATLGEINITSTVARMNLAPANWINGDALDKGYGIKNALVFLGYDVVGGFSRVFRVGVILDNEKQANNLTKLMGQNGQVNSGLVYVQCYPTTTQNPVIAQYMPFNGFYDCPVSTGTGVSVDFYFTP